MLIQFAVENYRSFNKEAELSLVRGPTRGHDSHIVRAEKRTGISALRTAVIYGANASGKSNLVTAIADAKNLITEAPKLGQPIPSFAFKLNAESIKSPTRFNFTVKISGAYYEYSFTTGNGYVHEESLSEVTRQSGKLIYKRVRTEKNRFKVESKLKLGKKASQLLDYEHKGTSENTLFLNQCVKRNVTSNIKQLAFIEDIFHWFDNDLIIIFPNWRYGNLEMDLKKRNYQEPYTEMIKNFGTGIDSLDMEEVPIDMALNRMPRELKEEFISDIKPKESILFADSQYSRFLIVSDEDNDLKAFKLITFHKNALGENVLFDLEEESDGTNRLLDLIPGLVNAILRPKTYIIDELDRSLHPDITHEFVSQYLKWTKDSGSQLIVTTHDLFLMDLDLVRRDELWYAQKNKKGESELYSLEEFESVEPDTDVLTGYRQGRYGGKPFLRHRLLSQMN